VGSGILWGPCTCPFPLPYLNCPSIQTPILTPPPTVRNIAGDFTAGHEVYRHAPAADMQVSLCELLRLMWRGLWPVWWAIGLW